KERDAIAAEQQQQQQQQVPEPVVPEVVQTPEPEVPKHLHFFNKDLEIDLPENQSAPSILARLFRIRKNEFQLLRRNKVFKVHETEDKFVPALKAKGKYEVIKLQQKQRRISNGSQYQDCVEESDECTIILNNIQQKIPGGNVKKSQIAGLFNLQSGFRLIGQDGAIQNHKNAFTLNPGATYHIIHSTQNAIKCPENEIDQMPPKELSLNRPMSHTAPYFISVLRILFTLSFTEDVVIFSDEITQETKSSTLLCPSTLSTCAYQIAYGFNDLAKEIQNVVSKIAKKAYKKSYDCSSTAQKYEVVSEAESEDVEEEKPQHQLFEDSNNSESPLKDIAKIIELHQKSITELEDFVQIVMKQMRANSPSVNSVKISLQIKAEQEKQKLQRKKLAKIDHQELQKICKIIQKNDEQICPTSGDLYAVSSNRDQQNHAFEIVEKILQDFGDECVYADIAELLRYCLQVSH
uniref:Uncharacterized protein n=1 Tax=Panagrolaimus sp. PS1159 TaxID=55785 RepID=A0AC35FST6_9BILA